MPHKLTITLNDGVYADLLRTVGRGNIGHFLENLAHLNATYSGTLTAAEGLGCTGYRGPAPTDARIKQAIK